MRVEPPVTAEADAAGVSRAELAPTPLRSSLGALTLVRALLLRWRLVGLLPLTAAAVAAVASLIVPPRYTTSVAFAPGARQSLQLPGALAGSAGQFGIDLGGASVQSPAFYIRVLQSRELMEAVLTSRYAIPDEPLGDSATLLDLLRVRGATPPERLGRGVDRLGQIVSTSADNQTGVVVLRVTTRHPTLSAAVATRFVTLLNEFNARRGQEQARNRRLFVEGRLQGAARDLRMAEDTLFHFLQKNRIYQSSPELQFEYGRLERQVNLRQELYLTLSRAYEDARIQEVNDVPVITVIDSAVTPWRRSSPSRRVWVLMAFSVTLMGTVTAAAALHYMDHLRAQDPEQFQEVADLMRSGWRRLAGAVGARGRRGVRRQG